MSEASGKAAQEKVLTDLGVKSDNANASGTGKAEIFYDGSNGSTINAGGGNDIVFGGGGNDTLNGGSGDDMLHGEKLAMPPLWALRRKPESSPPSFRRSPESSGLDYLFQQRRNDNSNDNNRFQLLWNDAKD